MSGPGAAEQDAPIILRAPDGARVEIHRHGAHVTSWTTADGREQLYLSTRAVFDGRAPIRGGVPVIFPQFADRGPLPKHGFARTARWDVLELRADGEAPVAVLALRDTAATRTLWPHRFRLALRVVPGPASLRLALEVRNDGDRAFEFTAALHTYLRVDDAGAASVVGLQGVRFSDALTGEAIGVDPAPAIVPDGPVNRVYHAVPRPVEVREAGHAVRSTMQGFGDVVLWNPGADGEAVLGDLDAGGSSRMVCVEAGVVASPVRLAPGAAWIGEQLLEAAGG